MQKRRRGCDAPAGYGAHKIYNRPSPNPARRVNRILAELARVATARIS